MKYDVLVAEDETPILRKICNMIESTNSDFYVSGTAVNGKIAIEALNRQHFHVAFLDINMPVSSGLEVLTYIHDNFPNMITIMLSGYQEFQYAQEALHYGAFDYLLKPLNKQSLNSVLKNAKTEIIKRGTLNPILPYADPYSTVAKFSEEEGICHIASVYLGPYLLQQSEMEVAQGILCSEKWLNEKLVSVYGKGNFQLVSVNRYASKVLIIKNHVNHPFTSLETIINSFPYELPITIIYDDIPVKKEQLFHAYRNLCTVAKNEMLFDKSIILNINSCLHISPQNIAVDFTSLLSNAHEMSLCFRTYHAVLKELNHPRRKDVIRITKNFVTAFLQSNSSCSYFDVEESILEALQASWNLDELAKKISQILLLNFNTTNLSEARKSEIAIRLHEYLEKNMDQYITMDLLEQKFGYVASHLRYLFKEKYDCVPLEYLQQLRLAKARVLLINGTSVKDAAQLVGFHDPLYFSRVFKKSTGCSPTEYRIKHML